jgi:RNA polymerase sigma-70 factor, ECF subfamily
LYNFARWLARNQTDAEDIVQETYLKAWRSFSSFQRGTNFRAWMFRILRNTFLTSRSGMGVTKTVPLGPEEGMPNAVETETPETILLCRSDTDLVRDALQELPNYYREIVLLCDVEELSYQEISETLSIPLGTVMSRLSRARNALREGLQCKGAGGTV